MTKKTVMGRVISGMLIVSMSLSSMAAEDKAAVKEPAVKKNIRKSLTSDKKLLFYAPFDFSVDAEKAYHNKKGSLSGKGEYVEGVVENCLSLPASAGKVSVSYAFADNIDFVKAGTMMFWFKPNWWGDNTVSNRCLVWVMLANKQYYALYRSFYKKSPTSLYAIIKGGGYTIRTSKWKRNKWVHIALTWDATTNNYKAYVNNKLQWTKKMYWLARLSPKDLQPYRLVLGKFYGTAPIDASYDEFYVFGRALAAKELADYYNETKPKE